jgi:phosphoglycerate dehydrogenase-like enzyme
MEHETLLVLGRPSERLLAKLETSVGPMSPTPMRLVVGDTAEACADAAADATVILAWSGSGDVMRRVLTLAPRVRWVHSLWAGLDHLPLAEIRASPAVLTNARGVFSGALGEWVLGAILYFAKDFRKLVRDQMAGRWDPYHVVGVAGKTVGIVGYGDIGRAVAVRAHALGMHVLGLTRTGPRPRPFADEAREAEPAAGAQGTADPAVRIFAPSDRIRMIEQCDYLVIATPLTPETRGMIGEAEIAAMRPDAVLINIGRGPVVSEAALVRALTEGRIKGAALDVFATEPLPGGHPLYGLENVLLSPHSADRTVGWLDRALQLFLENLERYQRGEPLANVVDKERGY